MANVAHAKRGAIIGVMGLVFAKLLTDTALGATPGTTYDVALHEVPGTIEVGLTASITDEVLGADDNPTYDIFSSLDSVDVSMTLAALGTDLEAFLLGGNLDDNGVLVTANADAAPWVAMGFKSKRSDGSYDYIWLYKGKFKHGDSTHHTKERGAVNWQTPAISATFGPRDFDGRIKARVNDKDEGLGVNTISTFLAAPYVPAVTVTP